MIDLPKPVTEIIDVLASLPGAVAVVLGGSRALGINDAGSDWDIGVYYRGTIDPESVMSPIRLSDLFFNINKLHVKYDSPCR